jgi:hypothetical protein
MCINTHQELHTPHAQSLSLLRAAAKPSEAQSAKLIASIANDTFGLYATAMLQLEAFVSFKPTLSVCVCELPGAPELVH